MLHHPKESSLVISPWTQVAISLMVALTTLAQAANGQVQPGEKQVTIEVKPTGATFIGGGVSRPIVGGTWLEALDRGEAELTVLLLIDDKLVKGVVRRVDVLAVSPEETLYEMAVEALNSNSHRIRKLALTALTQQPYRPLLPSDKQNTLKLKEWIASRKWSHEDELMRAIRYLEADRFGEAPRLTNEFLDQIGAFELSAATRVELAAIRLLKDPSHAGSAQIFLQAIQDKNNCEAANTYMGRILRLQPSPALGTLQATAIKNLIRAALSDNTAISAIATATLKMSSNDISQRPDLSAAAARASAHSAVSWEDR